MVDDGQQRSQHTGRVTLDQIEGFHHQLVQHLQQTNAAEYALNYLGEWDAYLNGCQPFDQHASQKLKDGSVAKSAPGTASQKTHSD